MFSNFYSNNKLRKTSFKILKNTHLNKFFCVLIFKNKKKLSPDFCKTIKHWTSKDFSSWIVGIQLTKDIIVLDNDKTSSLYKQKRFPAQLGFLLKCVGF